MGVGEPNLPGYKRKVTAELGMYASDGYALYTELFLSTTPWKDLARKVAAIREEGPPPVSNIAAWGILRRGLLADFENPDSSYKNNI